MTAEAVAFAEEQLFAVGALVYTVPAQMKKSRRDFAFRHVP